MSAWDMSFRSLRRRRLRTGLTASGIIVGVALMFVLLSLTSGMDAQTRQMVRSLGGADITVSNATTPGREGFGGPDFFGAVSTLEESYTETISLIPGVYAVTPELSFMGSINGTRATIYGIDLVSYFDVTTGLNIVSGNTISEDDEYSIVLGKATANSLNATVGESVIINTTISEKTFTIIGIFETGTTFQEYAGYILLDDAQNIMGQQGLVSQILVKCTDPNDVSDVSEAISSSISGIRATVPTSMVSQASSMLNTMSMFFAVIGLVALFAGSFGVVNTMLMSVSERTREIGTLKAIGAKNFDVLKIFMTEALLIGFIGGGVGVLIGAALSYVFPLMTSGLFKVASSTPIGGGGPFGGGGLFSGDRTNFSRLSTVNITPAIEPYNIFLCFSLGVLVGVLAGIYPAWRAAHMKPMEALKRG